MNDEERGELQVALQDANAVKAMVDSKGWLKVVKPAMENRMTALVNDFANATSYEEFVRVQQSINAIKSLMDFVEVKLMEGDTALKELRNNP